MRSKTQRSRFVSLLWMLVGFLIVAAGILTYYYYFDKTPSLAPLQALPQASDGSVSVTPLPENALENYKVAADNPRAIYIDKISVQARILPMGVDVSGAMQAPTNIYDTGWYTGSAKPGEAGAMVMDGHASQTGTHYGEFGRLEELNNGDIITIEKGDGTKLNYKVVHVEDDPLDKVDMNRLMTPYEGAAQGLNLITCAGDWTKDGKTLDHRILVFSVPA